MLLATRSFVDSDGLPEGFVRAIVSSDSLDSERSIIASDAWRGSSVFSRYSKNPILLRDHRRENSTTIIGRAIEWKVVDSGIEFLFEYDLGDPIAKSIYEKTARGFARGFSVGIMIKSAVTSSDDEEVRAPYQSYFDEGARYVITDLELFEVSQVVIPSNPDAVISEKALPPPDEEAEEMNVEKEAPDSGPLSIWRRLKNVRKS